MGAPAASIRAGRADDAATIARLMIEAGGGVFEFLLDDLVAGHTTASLMIRAVADGGGIFSHRACLVAELADRPAGVLCQVPAESLRGLSADRLPADRVAHLARMDAMRDWGSMFVNTLAVEAGARRRGIGRGLLRAGMAAARERGLPRLSLQVWADNRPAIRLYEAEGFVVLDRAAVAPHPRLARHGEVLLMGGPARGWS